MVEETRLLYYIEGLDESVLCLNDYFFDKEFCFIKYSLEEFYNNFKDIVPLRRSLENNESDLFESFLAIDLHGLRYFNAREIIKNRYVIFLQDWRFYEKRAKEEIGEQLRGISILKEIIKKLQLFKAGHIKFVSLFIFSNEIGLQPWSYSNPSERAKYKKYSLSEADVKELINFNYKKYFEENALIIPDYLKLSFNTFLEYYNIDDEELKFVILMIALESIFNKSSQEPITHIISRHVALLLEKDKESFKEKYDEVKRLYNLRCSIVHGKDKNETKKDFKNFSSDVLKLEDIVRNVLKKLIYIIHDFDSNKPKDKKELFDYLNAKGFPG